MKKVNLNDLYFGVKLFPLCYNSREELKTRGLQTYNLFDFSRVKWSVAKYVTMKEKERQALLSSPLGFCFGDVAHRVEYEHLVSPIVHPEDASLKVDTWSLYVEPNKDLLMKMVDSVSVSSATKYLREERKRLKGIK